MSKYDHYCFHGSTAHFAPLGAPFKVSPARYIAMKAAKFRVCRVPAETSIEAVIVKHLIDSGSHIKSYNVAKALEDYCGVKIEFTDIKEEE